jgi:flavin reductase (DIM6/NTAB) family NADH-FMN oxidoreductase RutF
MSSAASARVRSIHAGMPCLCGCGALLSCRLADKIKKPLLLVHGEVRHPTLQPLGASWVLPANYCTVLYCNTAICNVIDNSPPCVLARCCSA